MKKHLILLSLLYCTVGYGQKVREWKSITVYATLPPTYDTVWADEKDTIYLLHPITKKDIVKVKPKAYYGIAGISVDSSKIYYRKYVALKRTGIPDSVNKYFKLLNNYKNK